MVRILTWAGIVYCWLSCGIIMGTTHAALEDVRKRAHRRSDKWALYLSEVLIRCAVYGIYLGTAIWLLRRVT